MAASTRIGGRRRATGPSVSPRCDMRLCARAALASPADRPRKLSACLFEKVRAVCCCQYKDPCLAIVSEQGQQFHVAAAAAASSCETGEMPVPLMHACLSQHASADAGLAAGQEHAGHTVLGDREHVQAQVRAAAVALAAQAPQRVRAPRLRHRGRAQPLAVALPPARWGRMAVVIRGREK